MKALYSELYRAFLPDELSTYSHFVSMKGKYFDDPGRNGGIKLMIVGRAVNGWLTLDTSNEQTFGNAAQESFDAEGFAWIDNSGDSLRNRPQAGESTYYLSKSSFWRTSKNIWEGLSQMQEKSWIDYIAWSNIYKIAPLMTGNPTTNMCVAQMDACRKILKAEIEAYKPSHILFITGYEWWFYDKTNKCGISNLFDYLTFYGNNSRCNDIYVEGSAYYTLNDGTSIPVVITCRPETRPEDKFTSQVLDCFRLLKK